MSEATTVRLRDLGKWMGGNTPSKTNTAYWTDGTIPWVSPKDMKVDEIASSEDRITEAALADGRVSMVPKGSVLLVTRSGILAHTLPVAVTKLPVTINQDLKALTPKAGVSPKYVAHAVRGASRRILEQCSKHGTTVASIETNALLDFEIPMVEFDEQHRIVAEIEKQFSRLDEAVSNLNRVRVTLKRYRAAVLRSAVEGRLVLTEAALARREGRSYESGGHLLQRILETRRSQWKGKGKYKEPAALDTTDQPELPEGWASVAIAQLLPHTREAMKTGPFGSLLKKYEHQSEGIAVLGIENIQAMRFVGGSKIHITQQKAHELEDYRVVPGDILISRSGTVGEVCVVPNNIGDARMSTNLMKVSLAKEGMLPEFFMLLFNGSPFVLNQVSDLCKGSTRDFLNQEILKQLCFILPPLAEQHRIVAEVDRRLSLVRGVETEVEANMKRAHGLRQAILSRELSGEVDAPA